MPKKTEQPHYLHQPLKNKNAIITGASQGLGFAIAKEFLKAGANIAICARDAKKINAAKEELARSCNMTPTQKIFAMPADVSDEAEAKELIAKTIKEFGSIDILVNNAGILGIAGEIESVDCNEWKKAIDINLYGPLYVMHYAIPHLKRPDSQKNHPQKQRQSRGKIINISGGGATSPMPGLSAYAASKTAVARLTETVAQEVAKYNIDCNLVAPGALNTRILDQIIKAGPNVVGKEFYDKTMQRKKEKTDESGAFDLATQLCVYLASGESDGIYGKMISAVWDPWKTLAKYKKQIMKSDVYTLRRIIPTDRSKSFAALIKEEQSR